MTYHVAVLCSRQSFTQTFPFLPAKQFATNSKFSQAAQARLRIIQLSPRDRALFEHHNSYLQVCSYSSSVTPLPFPPCPSFSFTHESERERERKEERREGGGEKKRNLVPS